MKGYKITLEDITNNVFHYISVIADNYLEAIRLARKELGDIEGTDKSLVLYDIDSFFECGVISKHSHYLGEAR